MHGNARLTPEGRRILCERIGSGRPAAHVAAEMGISRTTAYRWWNRYETEGEEGLYDRSSRPLTSPTRTSPQAEAEVLTLRRHLKLGPVRIGLILGMPPSTVWRVLSRNGLNRLWWMDRPTGRVIRRYERSSPGELIHIDIKKLGRIPQGGGKRAVGRLEGQRNSRRHTSQNSGPSRRRKVGYGYIHAAVDDHTRLAYVEILQDETAVTATGFTRRAVAWFSQLGITTQAIMTDNGACYRSRLFADTLTSVGIRHTRIPPRQPQINGKVERFNRTLLDEWAYVRPYLSEAARTEALAHWIHTYNHHRNHTAIGGPPISRVNNLPRQHS